MFSEFLEGKSNSGIDWDRVDWDNYPDSSYYDDSFMAAQLVKVRALADKLKIEGTLSTMAPEEMYGRLREITRETAEEFSLSWPPPLPFQHKG